MGAVRINPEYQPKGTYTDTKVKGNAESAYRTGNVNLTPANIGAAASSHTHRATHSLSPTMRSGFTNAGAAYHTYDGLKIGYLNFKNSSAMTAGGSYEVYQVPLSGSFAMAYAGNAGTLNMTANGVATFRPFYNIGANSTVYTRFIFS